jgi:HEPN domain-containing protein
MDDYLKKWLIKANNDLKVAENEIELPSENMVTDAICFHCQQAVEKYLKAFLITKKSDFQRSHNLEYLLEICKENDAEFSELDLGNLSFYAVEVRYPDNFYIPSFDEARECLDLALKVKEFVLKKI